MYVIYIVIFVIVFIFSISITVMRPILHTDIGDMSERCLKIME